ncbi:MAG: hypothetical protein IZT59_03635 [Verrucomicrobia bacterium]|jgi:hypothetical protein|nr:hypothetical protein [Verrucomicrobiota bacterium]|tara:strand:+ start:23339 stop:23485 length:147 start_codon:yes stop_codon:yes gene_type:complete
MCTAYRFEKSKVAKMPRGVFKEVAAKLASAAGKLLRPTLSAPLIAMGG